jgi:hypothetical protein
MILNTFLQNIYLFVSKIWDVIANPEAIAINQAWAGFSGGPFQRSEQQVVPRAYLVHVYIR